mmetsp:Transcript_43241/g.77483  ORF Transcript_43241/g.77483 Transcript_43241/m.77483 type:complete len:313 (-) Transcript_43241:595-1533(-)
MRSSKLPMLLSSSSSSRGLLILRNISRHRQRPPPPPLSHRMCPAMPPMHNSLRPRPKLTGHNSTQHTNSRIRLAPLLRLLSSSLSSMPTDSRRLLTAPHSSLARLKLLLLKPITSNRDRHLSRRRTPTLRRDRRPRPRLTEPSHNRQLPLRPHLLLQLQLTNTLRATGSSLPSPLLLRPHSPLLPRPHSPLHSSSSTNTRPSSRLTTSNTMLSTTHSNKLNSSRRRRLRRLNLKLRPLSKPRASTRQLLRRQQHSSRRQGQSVMQLQLRINSQWHRVRMQATISSSPLTVNLKPRTPSVRATRPLLGPIWME